MLGGLSFNSETVFIFNVEPSKLLFPCEQHQLPCVDYINKHTIFVFKKAIVNGRSVLWADVVLLGVTACSIGYIDCTNLPKETTQFLCHSLYQEFLIKDESITDKLNEVNKGVIKAIQVGQCSNRLMI